jgi:hypothetical protein
MVITAKFSSKCPVCSNPIAPGDRVEWSKGEVARHLACVAGGTDRTPRGRYPGRRRRDEDNECELCGRDKYTCGHCIGW